MRSYFCTPKTNAKVAQLVERDLAKVEVAGSNPVFRSKQAGRPSVGFFVRFCPDSSDQMPGWWNW